MITDKERREVAKKLREPKESLLAYPADELIRLRRETGCPRGQDFYEHLADLIDRPVYRPVIPNAMEGYVFCPQCGAPIGEYGVPNYCHSCGVAIHNGC